MAASSRLSVSSWRSTRPRPAPSARRTLISRCRCAPRASSRLAMLAQASSSTRPVSDSSTYTGFLNMRAAKPRPRLPSSSSTRGNVSPAFTVIVPRMADARSTFNAACACASETPGLMRPITSTHHTFGSSRNPPLSPLGSISGCMLMDTKMSGDDCTSFAPVKLCVT